MISRFKPYTDAPWSVSTLGTPPLHTSRVRPGVICAHCTYELQGLDRHGYCPECGTPIQRSLQGDLLYYAHPPTLQRMAAGVLVLLLTYLLTLAWLQYLIHLTPAWARIPSTLALHGLLLAGGWMLTTPEPGSFKREPHLTGRRAARWALASLPAALALPLLWPWGEPPMTLVALRALALAATTLTLANHAVDLSLRDEDHAMAEQLKFLLLGLPILSLAYGLASEEQYTTFHAMVLPLLLQFPFMLPILAGAALAAAWAAWTLLRFAWKLWRTADHAQRANARVPTPAAPGSHSLKQASLHQPGSTPQAPSPLSPFEGPVELEGGPPADPTLN
jgi:hypothetical protein